MLYMFRTLFASIISSIINCNSSHWFLSWVGMDGNSNIKLNCDYFNQFCPTTGMWGCRISATHKANVKTHLTTSCNLHLSWISMFSPEGLGNRQNQRALYINSLFQNNFLREEECFDVAHRKRLNLWCVGFCNFTKANE